MILQLHFNDIKELQEFLEKFPDSKKYLEIREKVEGIRSHKPFTRFEDEHIVGNYYKKTSAKIASELQRTPQSISQRIHKFQKEGILKKKNNYPGRATFKLERY